MLLYVVIGSEVDVISWLSLKLIPGVCFGGSSHSSK